MQTYFPLLAFSATFWPSHSTENMVFADLELGITGEKIRLLLPLSGTCKTKKSKTGQLREAEVSRKSDWPRHLKWDVLKPVIYRYMLLFSIICMEATIPIILIFLDIVVNQFCFQ